MAHTDEEFAELVRSLEPRVRGVLWRLLDDERDLEEAVQDTFVQLWRNRDSFRRESAVFTWVYRIAVNTALMRLRRTRPEEVELEEERLPPRAADESDRADLRMFLLERLRALPAEYRTAVVLRDVEGLSNKEVADVLGISVAAAKSRIHRGRMAIRAALVEWEGGDV